MIKNKKDYYRILKLNRLGIADLNQDVKNVNVFIDDLFSELFIFDRVNDSQNYRYKYLFNNKGFYIKLDTDIRVMYIKSDIRFEYKIGNYTHRTPLEYIITDMIYDKLGLKNYFAQFSMIYKTRERLNIRPYGINEIYTLKQ
jgi:hypothetical protein